MDRPEWVARVAVATLLLATVGRGGAATAAARPNPQLLQIAAFIQRHQPEHQSPGARQRFTRLAYTLAERLTPYAGISVVWADANQLARSLRDPHTMIYLPDHAGTTLPLLFQTVSGGLVVFATTPQLRHLDGDRVLRIGAFTSGGVLRKLQSLYAGNVYFVNTIAWSDLMSSTALQWLGVIHHGGVLWCCKRYRVPSSTSPYRWSTKRSHRPCQPCNAPP